MSGLGFKCNTFHRKIQIMTEVSEKPQGALKEFLKTSLPAVVDLSSQPLVWLYEAFLISQVSIAALGGVGLAFQFIIVTFTAVLTFVIGSSLIINRHLGRDDSWAANHILGQSMMLGIGLACVIGFIWYAGAPLFFRIINESEPIGTVSGIQSGIQYLRTIAYFAPIIIVCYIALGIIRGSGDTHFALIINLVIIGINVFLAPFLIFGPWFSGREVVGLALAKGIAFSVGLLLTAILLRSRKCRLFLSMREMTTPKWESVKLLFKTGFPTTVEHLTQSSGLLIVSLYVARLNVVVLATHQILLLLQAVMSMFYQGLGVGSMTIIGKDVGAEDHRRAERTAKVAGLVTLLIVLIIVLIISSCSSAILQAFTDDQDVLDLGKKVIIIFAVIQIPKALNAVLSGNLRGAGELKWLMWLTITVVLIFEVSASWAVVFLFLEYQFKLAGIWLMNGCDEAARSLFNYVRFRNGKWKFKNV